MWPSEFLTYGSVTHIRIRFRYSKTSSKGNDNITQEIGLGMGGEPIAAGFLCLSHPEPRFVGLG
jgi:hypothetical protein